MGRRLWQAQAGIAEFHLRRLAYHKYDDDQNQAKTYSMECDFVIYFCYAKQCAGLGDRSIVILMQGRPGVKVCPKDFPGIFLEEIKHQQRGSGL